MNFRYVGDIDQGHHYENELIILKIRWKIGFGNKTYEKGHDSDCASSSRIRASSEAARV